MDKTPQDICTKWASPQRLKICIKWASLPSYDIKNEIYSLVKKCDVLYQMSFK
ncbi:hypothetical protein Hanom_Chr10g00955061 [Helianthus anomalus]